jgi:hypothetical protein
VANQYQETNELGRRVTGVWLRDMHMALEVSGAMLLWARQRFVDDLTARGISTDTLTDQDWFYWTTYYFNAGPGAGRRALDGFGVKWSRKKWEYADDFERYGSNGRFNAMWRTASLLYINETEYETVE